MSVDKPLAVNRQPDRFLVQLGVDTTAEILRSYPLKDFCRDLLAINEPITNQLISDGSAKGTWSMHREYHRWFSPRLQRDMELLIHGHAGARVLVFPTSMGRFFEYEDRGMVANLADQLENGWLQLFCVDSVDAESFYCRWAEPAGRITRHLQYEAYILHEVLPLTQAKNDNPFLIAHGCSFGAYHAVNIAFRHPHLFGRVLALSGKYDIAGFFDGYYDEKIYFNTPSHFVPDLSDPAILDAMGHLDIILAIGSIDPNVGNNRALSSALWSKGIWHAFREWPGWDHDWPYWMQMTRAYIGGSQ